MCHSTRSNGWASGERDSDSTPITSLPARNGTATVWAVGTEIHLVERLARARQSIRGSRERMDTYTRSLMEHGTEATERDISWLDSLIAGERQQGGQQS